MFYGLTLSEKSWYSIVIDEKEKGEDMSGIVIENVCKTFKTKDGTVQALNHVNLSIESGDIYTESSVCPVQVKVLWYAV